MNKYFNNTDPIGQIETDLYKQSTPYSTTVLEVSSDLPSMTYAEPPAYECIIQDSVSYSAPQKVIIRRYKLRK